MPLVSSPYFFVFILQLKNVPYERATQHELDYMIQVGVLLSGTRSATLVPYTDALYYLADIKRPIPNLNQSSDSDAPPPSWLSTRPRIHRRKPHPWEITRSLKYGNVGMLNVPGLSPSSDSFADFSFDDS